MAKRKILMVGWEFPPNNSGGLGVACQGIVENLVDSGEDVTLVLPKPMAPNGESGNTLTTDKGNKYKVIYIPSKLRPYIGHDGKQYCGDLVKDVNLFADDVIRAVGDEDFDLVHVHDWLTVPAGIKVKKKFGKPMVMHVHSTEFDRTAGGKPNIDVEKIEKKGFKEADLIITVSNYTKSLLVDKYGIDERKIKVVHNGLDNPKKKREVNIDFLKDSPVIIFVGRLTIQKGPEYFIELARNVLDKRPDAVFIFAGNGDMFHHLLLTSAYRNLSGSVLFAGFLRDAAKDRLYQRADVFVMPSVSEPFGIVALEAAAVGVPVIVSKTSGVAEVLPSAIKLDFWDVEKMAENVLKLIEKSERGKEVGTKVMEEAGAITWEKAAMKIKDAYQQLLIQPNV